MTETVPRPMILEQSRLHGQRVGARIVERTPSKAARMLPELGTQVNRATSSGMRALGQAEAILDNLHAATRCRICGRDLTDPVSVKRGIGPDCIAKLRHEAELERAYRATMAAVGRPAGLDSVTIYAMARDDDRATAHRSGDSEAFPIALTIPEGAHSPKSPDGHAYGYGGSGPAQLALDVLTHHLGRQPHPALYFAFKAKFIGGAEGDRWSVTSEEIDLWLIEAAEDEVPGALAAAIGWEPADA